MAMKTQGTQLWTIDPDTGAVIEVGCVTSIDGIDTSLDQIETTCLNALARTYEAGLATPGTATFGINSDPRDDSHIRLHQLKVAGTTLPWAIGWSDGTAAPTSALNTDGTYDFVTPTSRSWIVFEGFMNSFPFTFGQNAVVQSNVGIQVSGEPEWIPAAS
jgi:hypothetical protein